MSVELLQCFTTLKSGVETLTGLRDFVEDQLASFLHEVGLTQFNAALRALSDASKGRDIRREVESAITHLRSAYYTFLRAGESTWFKRIVSSFWGTQNRPNSYKDACLSCILIAICYKYLQENSLVQDYLSDAKKCFSNYSELWLARYEIEFPEYGIYGQWEFWKKRLEEEEEMLNSICNSLEKI
jgi:hypothetical protein